jgi:hypothetical protein
MELRPVKLDEHCGGRNQDCHEQNWLDNAFSMNILDFSQLKRGRRPPFLEPVVRDLGGERDETSAFGG